MRFQNEQTIAGPIEAVARIYTEPRFYEVLGELPKLGKPEVLERREEGHVVHLAVRLRFTGILSPAVTAIIDPAKLSWVEESVHDLTDRTRRSADGEVAVRVPLVGKTVENAIVSGLREHLAAEVEVVERLL